MLSKIKIYKINDFIRMNESGKMDFDKSIQTVRELSTATSFHPSHNILIDLRDTTVSNTGMDELMKIVMEFNQRVPHFKKKIANLVPNDTNRISIAKRFEACMAVKQYNYKFFTNFEDALDWLSDIET
jgi:hypothetical protein